MSSSRFIPLVKMFMVAITLFLCNSCGTKSASNRDSCDTTTAVSDSETTEDNGLNSFFSNIEIPKFTLQDAIVKRECNFLGFVSGSVEKSAMLIFNDKNGKVEVSGYGFWGTEFILKGAIKDKTIIVKSDGEDFGDFRMELPTDNLGYFSNGKGEEKTVWFEEDVWKKIEETTPVITYSSPDGMTLKMKYYSPSLMQGNEIAYGTIEFEKCSKEFCKRIEHSEQIQVKPGELKDEVWDFCVSENGEILCGYNMYEAGYLSLSGGEWSPERITYPSITEKGLPEVVFTR